MAIASHKSKRKLLDNKKIQYQTKAMERKKVSNQKISEYNPLKVDLIQKLRESQILFKKSFDDEVQKVKVKLYFSKEYFLNICLPSSLSIDKTFELASSYVKLHLRYLPSKGYTYSGLKFENPLCLSRSMHLDKIKRQQMDLNGQIEKQDVKFWQQICKFIINSVLVNESKDGALMNFLQSQNILKKLLDSDDLVSKGQLVTREENPLNCLEIYVRYDLMEKNQQKLKIKEDIHIEQQKQQKILTFEDNDSQFQSQTKLLLQSKNEDLVTFQPKQMQVPQEKEDNGGKFNAMIRWFSQVEIVDWALLIDQLGSQPKNPKLLKIPLRLKGKKQIYDLLICSDVDPNHNKKNRIIKSLLLQNPLSLNSNLEEYFSVFSSNNKAGKDSIIQVIILEKKTHAEIQFSEHLEILFLELAKQSYQQKTCNIQIQKNLLQSSQVKSRIQILYSGVVLLLRELVNAGYYLHDNFNVLSLFKIGQSISFDAIQVLKRQLHGEIFKSRRTKNQQRAFQSNLLIKLLNEEIVQIIKNSSKDYQVLQQIQRWFTDFSAKFNLETPNFFLKIHQEQNKINNLCKIIHFQTLRFLKSSQKSQQTIYKRFFKSLVSVRTLLSCYESSFTLLQEQKSLKVIDSYIRPTLIEFKQGDKLNIYQQQTTLKKKLSSHQNSNKNSVDMYPQISRFVYDETKKTSNKKNKTKKQTIKNSIKENHQQNSALISRCLKQLRKERQVLNIFNKKRIQSWK